MFLEMEEIKDIIKNMPEPINKNALILALTSAEEMLVEVMFKHQCDMFNIDFEEPED